MFPLSLFRRRPPALRGKRVRLRVPHSSDFREWAALRRESAGFLIPWEPRWATDELERTAWNQRLRRYRREAAGGTAIAFLIFENEGGRLVGGITMGNIRYGVSQSAQLGYWMGQRYAGRGFMQDAIAAMLQFAFETMRLHRMEAACIPSNQRSIHVLEKAGFRREGLLQAYLLINGKWQDHFLYGLISEDWRVNRQG